MTKRVPVPPHQPYPKSAPIPPILSGVQFAESVNNTGGATADLRTGRLLKPGTKGYIVGSEPDSKGRTIPTVQTRDALTPRDAVGHRARLRQATQAPGASLGGWKDTETGIIHIDASRVTSKTKATKLGKQRGEIALWDNKRMKEVRLK